MVYQWWLTGEGVLYIHTCIHTYIHTCIHTYRTIASQHSIRTASMHLTAAFFRRCTRSRSSAIRVMGWLYSKRLWCRTRKRWARITLLLHYMTDTACNVCTNQSAWNHNHYHIWSYMVMIPQSLSLSIYRVCPTHPSSIHLPFYHVYPFILSADHLWRLLLHPWEGGHRAQHDRHCAHLRQHLLHRARCHPVYGCPEGWEGR